MWYLLSCLCPKCLPPLKPRILTLKIIFPSPPLMLQMPQMCSLDLCHILNAETALVAGALLDCPRTALLLTKSLLLAGQHQTSQQHVNHHHAYHQHACHRLARHHHARPPPANLSRNDASHLAIRKNVFFALTAHTTSHLPQLHHLSSCLYEGPLKQVDYKD